MRGAGLALLLALAGCAAGEAPRGEATAGPEAQSVHARGVERRRAEIAALEASAERNPAAAVRVRALRREVAQIEEDARIGADTSPASRHGLRF
jgi:hypothetical protein